MPAHAGVFYAGRADNAGSRDRIRSFLQMTLRTYWRIFEMRSFILGLALLIAAGVAGAQTTAPASTRIAVVDTGVFADQTAGLKTVTRAYASLATEFKPRSDEINTLQTRLQQLVREYEALAKSGSASPAALSTKQEQIEVLRRDVARKTEDTRAQISRREQEVMRPILEGVGKALETYAKQQKIDLVVDISRANGAFFVTNSSVDITKAFIQDYNSKNP
jgi:Skp family chaperone for outer membrane proteins